MPLRHERLPAPCRSRVQATSLRSWPVVCETVSVRLCSTAVAVLRIVEELRDIANSSVLKRPCVS